MPALQRLRCDEKAGPTVAWENAADGGEQSAVGGFQLGPGGLPLEDDELRRSTRISRSLAASPRVSSARSSTERQIAR
jgi:hypothetical protein